ncbi:unnamed protein product [Auanema sp. JU1783]|nr:unnamed protein product [Auanema sp. JU1783]
MVKNLILKCKGLPYSCTEDDLRKFLGEAGIAKVELPMRDGKAMGDATVHFDNDIDFNNALKKDREHMGHRYIEVFPADEDRSRPRFPPSDRGRGRGDYGYGGGRGGPPRRNDRSSTGNDGIVRLRGLPFSARERDIHDFFAPLPIVPNGVLLPDPRDAPKNNGEAFVVFENTQSASLALQRHMKNMQHRYIEVFNATSQEMVRFCEDNRIRVPRSGGRGNNYGGGSGRGGYDDYPQSGGFGGSHNEYNGGGYGRSPTYERRSNPTYEPAYGSTPQGDYGWGAPDNRPAPADTYARAGDPYSNRSSGDGYGRPAEPYSVHSPSEDPFGRRAYPPDDDYTRPVRPDPYMRAADPYGRSTAESWRDDRSESQRNPNPPSYGENGSWDGYGYGSDYRQHSGGGPIRREASGGPWREDRREVPRGRERPGQKYILKMRGVPFRAVEADVYDFFTPIRPQKVEIIREPGGRPSGEARVEFETRKDYDDALLKDKQYMGARYVELFPDFGGRY